MKVYRLVLSLISLLLIAGCSMSKNADIAEKKVAEFHSALDAGQFVEIYAASDDELKKISKEQDFVALLEAVNHKLGKSKTSEKVGWNVNYRTSGTFVTLTYKTFYQDSVADEQFVYRIHNDQAKLVGYHINSNALITK